MRLDGNGGMVRNYEPNSFNGPVETGAPLYAPLKADGPSGIHEWEGRGGDDFSQAGALYRVTDEAARERLVSNIAGGVRRTPHPVAFRSSRAIMVM